MFIGAYILVWICIGGEPDLGLDFVFALQPDFSGKMYLLHVED